MKKIRTAFFGLAHPHVISLASTITQHPDQFEIIGFAEMPLPSEDPYEYGVKRRKLIEKYGMKEYEKWEDLLAEKPDFAIVNSANSSREEVCCTLLNAGVHVLDEKPLAMTFDAAEKICRCAEKNGVRMLTNWPIAWFPAFRLAKQLLDEGRIGKLMRVTYRSPATWGPYSYSKDGSLPPDEDLSTTWWYKAEMGGGSILDYACYGTLLSTWMFGKQAERVSGIAKNFCTKFSNIEDYSAMMLDFGDGVGLLEGSWSTFHTGEVPTGPILYGTEGVIVCDRHTSKLKLYKGKCHAPTPPAEVFDVNINNNQNKLLGDHLAKVLRGEEEPDTLISTPFNLAVVAALDAGIRSTRSGVAEKTRKYTK